MACVGAAGQLRGHAGARVGRAIRRDHPHAGLGERNRHGAPDTGSGAGHHGVPALKLQPFVHVWFADPI